MKNRDFRKPACAGLLLLALSSCDDSAATGSGFERQYAVTRDALEDGRFDKAARGYARLVPDAGRYRPYVQLEYAHALLRSNDFAGAAAQARALAGSQSGPLRGAALAVQGTAEHELGMATPGEGGRAYLVSAQSALAEVLKSFPQLDTIGTLSARKARLDSELAGRG